MSTLTAPSLEESLPTVSQVWGEHEFSCFKVGEDRQVSNEHADRSQAWESRGSHVSHADNLIFDLNQGVQMVVQMVFRVEFK
jgi:hypothetical protein